MPGVEPQRPSYDELAQLVVAQAARVAKLEALEAEVVGLRAELAELRRRLATSSLNSSKPSLQDGLARSKRSSGSSGWQAGQAARRAESHPDAR